MSDRGNNGGAPASAKMTCEYVQKNKKLNEPLQKEPKKTLPKFLLMQYATVELAALTNKAEDYIFLELS